MPLLSRRRSSSSSRSRSLSPYNKRRRPKSPEKYSSRRNASRRSRSPRRSKSPRRRSPPGASNGKRRPSSPGRGPHRRRSLSPRRRRSSPVRRSPPRRRSPSPKRRSPSPKRPSPKRRSPSPKKRSPSPKRRSPSPKRRPSPPPRKRTPSPRSKPQRQNRRSPVYRSPPRRKSPLKRSVSAEKPRYGRSKSPARRPPGSRPEERDKLEQRHPSSLAKRHRSRSPRVAPPPPPLPPNDPNYMSHAGDNILAMQHISSVPMPPAPIVGTLDVDYRQGAGRGAKEPKPSRREVPEKNATDVGYTGVSTHDRFAPLSTSKDFTPKDLISIGIERNLLGDEPAVIPPMLRSEHVAVRRRKDEGDKPIHLRHEFETPEEDIEEKRTIKVLSSDNEPSDSKKKSKFEHENFEVRRDGMSLSDRWSEKESAREQTVRLRRHGDVDERLVTSRGSDKSSERRRERARSPIVKMTISDRDERIVASRDSGARRASGDKARDKDARELPRDPNDLRYNLSRKRGERGVMDAREKIRSRRGEEKSRRSG